MKAILSKTVGGPETLVLEDVPSLSADDGQVVISVKACGVNYCLLYTSPSPRDQRGSRMPSSA